MLEDNPLIVINSWDIGTGYKYGLGINYHCFTNRQDWNALSITHYGGKGPFVESAGPLFFGYISWDNLIEDATKPK